MRSKSTRNAPIRQLTEAERFNPPTEGKYITYDRATADYILFIDGEYVGHAYSYLDGENRLNEIIHDRLLHTNVVTADQAADMADLDEISELVDALAAQLGTGDLGYAREVLGGGFRKVCADWDAGHYALVEAHHAARCNGCGGGGQLVYGLCARCRLMTRRDEPTAGVGRCRTCNAFSGRLKGGECPGCRGVEDGALMERSVGETAVAGTIGNCRQCGNWTMRLLDGLCPMCKPRISVDKSLLVEVA